MHRCSGSVNCTHECALLCVMPQKLAALPPLPTRTFPASHRTTADPAARLLLQGPVRLDHGRDCGGGGHQVQLHLLRRLPPAGGQAKRWAGIVVGNICVALRATHAAVLCTLSRRVLHSVPTSVCPATQALDRGAALVGADKIATGHNADDVAETVLLNILRGDVPRWGFRKRATSG